MVSIADGAPTIMCVTRYRLCLAHDEKIVGKTESFERIVQLCFNGSGWWMLLANHVRLQCLQKYIQQRSAPGSTRMRIKNESRNYV